MIVFAAVLGFLVGRRKPWMVINSHHHICVDGREMTAALAPHLRGNQGAA